MCGIVAVVRRRSERDPVAPGEVLALLEEAVGALRQDPLTEQTLDRAAANLEHADARLRGVPGINCLLGAPDLAAAAGNICMTFSERITAIERALDADNTIDGPTLERINAGVIRV